MSAYDSKRTLGTNFAAAHNNLFAIGKFVVFDVLDLPLAMTV